jgi:hypothetical protein
MEKRTAVAVTAIASALIGVGVGSYARAKNWIVFPAVNRQVVGDPPITVSDGSLHVHSKLYGWNPDSAGGDKSFNAVAKDGSTNGTLSKSCNTMMDDSGDLMSAELWTDDLEAVDISPDKGKSLTITITHDGNDVVITAPPEGTAGALNVNTSTDFFFQSEGKGNRRHKRQGEVSKIVVQGHGSKITWKPSNPANPHFTFGFCYQ